MGITCDENLKNDIFSRAIEKSSKGYMSLKTVSNFKKIETEQESQVIKESDLGLFNHFAKSKADDHAQGTVYYCRQLYDVDRIRC